MNLYKSKKILILIVSCLILMGQALLAQTKTEMKAEELQKSIRDYIALNFKGFTIDRVFKVDTRGVITYDICINKENNHEKVFFSKEGKFLRKETCTNDCCQSPPKKH
jgi:hypothetical protein